MLIKLNESIGQKALDPDFVTGLIDGDGSFFISFKVTPRSGDYRLGRVNKKIIPSFTVIQDTSSKEVLKELQIFFNCGNIYDLKTELCELERLYDSQNF